MVAVLSKKVHDHVMHRLDQAAKRDRSFGGPVFAVKALRAHGKLAKA
jgi:hypothetical protein